MTNSTSIPLSVPCFQFFFCWSLTLSVCHAASPPIPSPRLLRFRQPLSFFSSPHLFFFNVFHLFYPTAQPDSRVTSQPRRVSSPLCYYIEPKRECLWATRTRHFSLVVSSRVAPIDHPRDRLCPDHSCCISARVCTFTRRHFLFRILKASQRLFSLCLVSPPCFAVCLSLAPPPVSALRLETSPPSFLSPTSTTKLHRGSCASTSC